MEEKIKKAFEMAEYMSVLSNQKNLLKEEYYQNLYYYYNGGTFYLSKELLTFVKLLVDNNQLNDVVLIGNNQIPVMVDNLKEFFENILSKHVEASNLYYTKYIQLTKNRKLEYLVDIE